MCIVCILINKDKLTNKEAKKALFELIIDDTIDKEHIQKLFEKIEQEELEEYKK